MVYHSKPQGLGSKSLYVNANNPPQGELIGAGGVSPFVSKTLIFKHGIEAPISKSTIFKHSILATISKSTIFKHGIEAAVSKSIIFKHTLIGVVSKSIIFKHTIFETVAPKSIIFKHEIVAGVPKSIIFKHPIIGVIAKSIIFKHGILAPVSKSILFKHDIATAGITVAWTLEGSATEITLEGSATPITFEGEALIPPNWHNDSTIKRRAEFEINISQLVGIHTDFRYLVHRVIPDMIGNVLPDGADIRFALSDGVQLKHEVVFIDNTTGEIYAWVKIPSAAAGTNIFMYYDKPTAVAPPLIDEQATWSGLESVYHLQETVVSSIKDSTGNTSFTSVGNPPVVALVDRGQIKNALEFLGANPILTTSMATATGVWSFWCEPEDANARFVNSYIPNEWRILQGFTTGNFDLFPSPTGNAGDSIFPFTVNEYSKITIVVRGQGLITDIYENGELVHALTDIEDRSGSTALQIGQSFIGLMEELRFNPTIPPDLANITKGEFNQEIDQDFFSTLKIVDSLII